MPDQQQLIPLKQGQSVWNKWRRDHPGLNLNFENAELSRVDLRGADLSEVTLMGANLAGANLSEANLRRANLRGANLKGADLSGAILSEVKLGEADLSLALLSGTDLSFADLHRADLTKANLVKTNLKKANLVNCRIYGISAWDVILDGAIQLNLVITSAEQPTITVDNLEVAQFIYLLLNNEKIRGVFDTLTSKIVLILGRFSAERETALSVLRDQLRQHNYLPVLFDFEKPSHRELTETIRILANMSRFIIADITSPSSIPQELQTIVSRRAVPILPLLKRSNKEFAMFNDFVRYPWVLSTYRYEDVNDLLSSFTENIIRPLESKAHELEELKEEKAI